MSPLKEDEVTDLASSHALAAAVSAITARICGMTFVPGEAPDRSEAARGRLFIFPVRGRRRFGLLLSCDRPTSVSLTCRMTGGAVDATPGELVEASIRDLLSRVAAGLERALDASPAASLLPRGLLAAYDLRASRRHLMTTTEALLVARADELVRRLDDFNNGLRLAAERLSRMPSVVAAITGTDAREAGGAIDVLDLWAKSDPKHRGVAVLDARGMVTLTTEPALAGKTLWSRGAHRGQVGDGRDTAGELVDEDVGDHEPPPAGFADRAAGPQRLARQRRLGGQRAHAARVEHRHTTKLRITLCPQVEHIDRTAGLASVRARDRGHHRRHPRQPLGGQAKAVVEVVQPARQ